MIQPEEINRVSVPNVHQDNDLGVYEKLVRWYTSKSMAAHVAILVGIATLGLVEFSGIYFKAPFMEALAGPVNPHRPIGYQHYSPTFWLLGLLTGLIAMFARRYSSVGGMREKSTHFADSYEFPRWLQHLLIHGTYILLAVETYGIATNRFTISAFTRGVTIQYEWLYWLGGILAAGFAFPIVDLRRLPRFVRLVLVIWVAICSHIFWWITPS